MLAAKKTSVLLTFALFTAIIGSGVGIFAQRTEPVEAKQPKEPPALAVDQDDPKNDDAKKDRYGDPLPPGAIARLGTVRFRAPAEVDTLAFAPDAKTIAVTSAPACSSSTLTAGNGSSAWLTMHSLKTGSEQDRILTRWQASGCVDTYLEGCGCEPAQGYGARVRVGERPETKGIRCRTPALVGLVLRK